MSLKSYAGKNLHKPVVLTVDTNIWEKRFSTLNERLISQNFISVFALIKS